MAAPGAARCARPRGLVEYTRKALVVETELKEIENKESQSTRYTLIFDAGTLFFVKNNMYMYLHMHMHMLKRAHSYFMRDHARQIARGFSL